LQFCKAEQPDFGGIQARALTLIIFCSNDCGYGRKFQSKNCQFDVVILGKLTLKRFQPLTYLEK
jgi:hypothetical protein